MLLRLKSSSLVLVVIGNIPVRAAWIFVIINNQLGFSLKVFRWWVLRPQQNEISPWLQARHHSAVAGRSSPLPRRQQLSPASQHVRLFLVLRPLCHFGCLRSIRLLRVVYDSGHQRSRVCLDPGVRPHSQTALWRLIIWPAAAKVQVFVVTTKAQRDLFESQSDVPASTDDIA